MSPILNCIWFDYVQLLFGQICMNKLPMIFITLKKYSKNTDHHQNLIKQNEWFPKNCFPILKKIFQILLQKFTCVYHLKQKVRNICPKIKNSKEKKYLVHV